MHSKADSCKMAGMRYEDVPPLLTWQRDSAVFASAGSTSRVAAIASAWGKPGAQMAASAPPGSRAGLAPIDAAITTYHKAFSPMAKTNVLNDLRRSIEEWQRTHPGPLPMAMGALKDVVDRKLNLRASTSRYNKAICIAYHFGCNYQKATGITHGLAASHLNTSYFRHSPDDRADMERKCADMWTGIEAARTGIAARGVGDDNRTLKIFMGPEFYFRGQNGAYAPEIVSSIIPRMRSLGTAKPIYDDWLFVFGTAVASIETALTYCTVCPWTGVTTVRFERNVTAVNPADRAKTIAKCSVNPAHPTTTGSFGAEVQNVALIQHGGDSHMVAKEYISGIDYTNNRVRVHPDTADEQIMKVRAPEGGEPNPGNMPVQSDERLGGSIFTLDGLTVGLEVCLDHSLASPGQPEYGRASVLAPTIQILLIPSYGMTIGQGLHCRPNGIAFNVDGRGRGNSEVKLNAPPYTSRPAITINDRISLYGPFNIPG